MVAYTYSKLPTANFNTTPPSIARSATGSVYDIGDTGFTTPLNMTMVIGGAVVTTISSDALGFLPDFTLLDRVKCVWKQTGSSFATVLTTSDPIPGPPGPNTVPTQSAIQSEVTTPGTPTAAALTATYASKADVVPKWKANTAYASGQIVVNPSGDTVSAKAAFTSGATYNAANWNNAYSTPSRDATTGQWHFDVLQGTNNGTKLPFTSRVVDVNGNVVAEQINAKPTTDLSEGVIDWQHNSSYGDLIHLTAGAGMTGSTNNAALIALGLDNGYPMGLFVNNKGHADGSYGIGIKIAQNSTINTATQSYGFQVDQFSPTSPAMFLHQADATAPLMRLQADTSIASNSTVLMEVIAGGAQKGALRAKTGELYWGADVITHDGAGFLNVATGVSADSNQTKQLSDGFHIRAYSGSAGIYYPARTSRSSGGFKLDVAPNTSGGPSWTGLTWQTGVTVKPGTAAASTMLGLTAPATTATEGFPYMPSVAGAPTGVPAAQTGYSPFLYDTANNKLWVYNGGWKGVVLA